MIIPMIAQAIMLVRSTSSAFTGLGLSPARSQREA